MKKDKYPTVNGYSCYMFEKGIYYFSKKEGKGWFEIACSEEQISNGNIEFMTENGLTLDKKRIKKIQKEYEKR